MSYHKRSRKSVLLLAVAAICLCVLPARTARAGDCIYVQSTQCSVCFGPCDRGQAPYAYSCADGSKGSGFSQCSIAEVEVAEQTQSIQDEKVILSQLMAKDPEIVRDVRRLAAATPVVCDNGA